MAGKKKKVWTTGTLYEKETGRYQSSPWEESPDYRPIGHKKKTGTGKATVNRGSEKPKNAQRGVGQPTIDGFIEGLERRKKSKRK